MTELLTVSRLRAFHACPRLHYYLYLACVRPRRVEAAPGFGRLVHAGLEQRDLARREGRPHEEVLGLALAAVRATWAGFGDERAEELDEFMLARALEAVRGYCLRYESDPCEVIGSEVQFEIPLVNPSTGRESRTYRLGGKIDSLWRQADEKLYVVERKTSTEDLAPGSVYWERLRMDSQVALYLDGAAVLGHGEIAGCVYDVILRPPLRRLSATPIESRKYTKDGALYAKQRLDDEPLEEFQARVREAIATEPDRYYRRGEVVRLDQELHDFRWDCWHTARIMRETQLSGRHVRNPAACFRWGRQCEFWPVCTGAASIDDPTRFVRSEVQHPELDSSKEEAKSGEERQGNGGGSAADW